MGVCLQTDKFTSKVLIVLGLHHSKNENHHANLLHPVFRMSICRKNQTKNLLVYVTNGPKRIDFYRKKV